MAVVPQVCEGWGDPQVCEGSGVPQVCEEEGQGPSPHTTAGLLSPEELWRGALDSRPLQEQHQQQIPSSRSQQ